MRDDNQFRGGCLTLGVEIIISVLIAYIIVIGFGFSPTQLVQMLFELLR